MSKYPDEIKDAARALFLKRWLPRDIARELNIPPRTIYHWADINQWASLLPLESVEEAISRRINQLTVRDKKTALELEERKASYPQLAVEKTKALYFPFPIYFWVRKDNKVLAQHIERGLTLALADGSFRKLFETYHAKEIAALAKEKRHVIRLNNPNLPAGDAVPDTHWWWR